MDRIKPEDDYCHHDYPKDTSDVWKENWYFSFVDKDNKAWGMNHISLTRNEQVGRFRAMHIVDDEPLIYEENMELTDPVENISDGKLSFEIIEPHRKHRIVFNGPKHSVDLVFEARFELVDFLEGKEDQGDLSNKSMHIEHYEQAMTVSGSVTKDGKTRTISCLGHRDHSWGFRNENLILGWNWVAVQFPDRTFSFSKATITEDFFMDGGFIHDAAGSVRIKKMEMVSTDRDESGAPITTTYKLEDVQGRTWTIISDRFSHITVPMAEKEDGIVYENFSSFIIQETNETGLGIDEYMETHKTED
jgi:hypothetical protein